MYGSFEGFCKKLTWEIKSPFTHLTTMFYFIYKFLYVYCISRMLVCNRWWGRGWSESEWRWGREVRRLREWFDKGRIRQCRNGGRNGFKKVHVSWGGVGVGVECWWCEWGSSWGLLLNRLVNQFRMSFFFFFSKVLVICSASWNVCWGFKVPAIFFCLVSWSCRCTYSNIAYNWWDLY